ncbi:polysaccharide pyruvyl transferase family protein [Oleomonas cavernae]|nr:polysaccharide pyruvyl transferase family protein [Oleomonas cavernae]
MSKHRSVKTATLAQRAVHKQPGDVARDLLATLVPDGALVLDLTDGSHLALAALDSTRVAVIEQPLLAGPAANHAIALEALSDALLARVDLVTLLVPWGRIANAEAVLARIAAAGCALICAVARKGERALATLAQAQGLIVTATVVAATGPTLMQLAPATPRPSPPRLASGDTVEPAAAAMRPALLVAGFYGRGNCGDEALFQSIYETFAPSCDIIVAVNKFGALDGYEGWYPYNRCEIVHQCSQDIFESGRPIAAMMIGGGGLAVGFAANLVMEARARGIPTFLSGVDLPNLDMPACDPPDREVVQGPDVVDHAVMRDYLAGFAQVMVRTRHGQDVCRQLQVPAAFGSDWALKLAMDAAPDVTASRRRALVVLREFPLPLVPFSYVLAIEELILGLRAQGWEPAFLPFCPEDARNTEQLDLARLAPTLEHWWNPRRVKQLIGSSGLVIAVGRLHPLIFAATLGVPTASLLPPLPLPSGRQSISKIDAVCADWGISQFPDVDALLEATAAGIKGVTKRKLATAMARLDKSIIEMKAIIAGA